MIERIYTSGKKNKSLLSYFKDIVGDFKNSYELGLEMAVRNLKSTYRGSYLGIIWSAATPISTAVLWIFLRQLNIIQVENISIPYPLYVYSGTMMWQIFTSAINTPATQVRTNRNLLVKLNIPKESLIISGMLGLLARIVPSILIFIFLLFLFKIEVSASIVVMLPVMVILILIGLMIGLILMPFLLLLKDLQFGLPLVLQALFYFTPVVYATPINSFFSTFFKINPLTYLFEIARMSINMPLGDLHLTPIIFYLLLSAVGLIFAVIYQRISLEIIVERLGS